MPEERINRQGWRHFVDVPEQTNAQKPAQYVTAWR